jgi:hypothetical protein
MTSAGKKMAVFWVLRRVIWYKLTDVSEMPAIIRAISCFFALMMAAVRRSET